MANPDNLRHTSAGIQRALREQLGTPGYSLGLRPAEIAVAPAAQAPELEALMGQISDPIVDVQNGFVSGALGPVEVAISGVRVGLAANFGELPSGGVRRTRDVIGTNSPRSLSLSGEVIDEPISSPKVLARVLGEAESLRRVRDSRGPKEIKPRVKREGEWGAESLGPDIENPAVELTDDEFQHLTIEDQMDRMLAAKAVEDPTKDLEVDRWVFGYISPEEVTSATEPGFIESAGVAEPQVLSDKDQERAARSRVLEARAIDQDPDRSYDRQELNDDKDLHPRRVDAISARGARSKAHVEESRGADVRGESDYSQLGSDLIPKYGFKDVRVDEGNGSVVWFDGVNGWGSDVGEELARREDVWWNGVDWNDVSRRAGFWQDTDHLSYYPWVNGDGLTYQEYQERDLLEGQGEMEYSSMSYDAIPLAMIDPTIDVGRHIDVYGNSARVSLEVLAEIELIQGVDVDPEEAFKAALNAVDNSQ